MGGNSGGSGNGGSNVPGTPIVPVTRAKPRKRKKSILEYSPTYQAIKYIGKVIKTSRINKSLEGTSDFQGTKSRVINRNPLSNRDDRDRNNNQNNQQNIKSEVQPKVASQMDAVKPEIEPIGPTSIEMTDDEKLLKKKRRGRKPTILTSVTGITDTPTLSKKALLG